MINKYIGRTVQIIYIDRNRNISIRIIQVRSVHAGKVKAFCYTANAPRIFDVGRILDIEPVKQHVS